MVSLSINLLLTNDRKQRHGKKILKQSQAKMVRIKGREDNTMSAETQGQ